MILEIKELPRKHPKATGKPPRSLVLRCDGCNNTFERKWLKETYDATTHFCSLTCHYSHRGGVGGYGAEVTEKPCLSCGKTLRFRKTGGERKWGKTCSRSCYADYRSKHAELYSQNTAAMHTEESWKKIREDVQDRMSKPVWTPSFKGEHHTEETKSRMRDLKRLNPSVGEKNGMFGRGRLHTEESRDKMSETRTRKMIDGALRPYGKNNHVSGEHESSKTGRRHRYRSSWELAAMKHLDIADEVVTWNYECLRVPYYYENNKRWHVPDFLVEFIGGRKEIWEIKPKELVSTRACQLKSEAAKKYCESEGISEYRILCRTDLIQTGIL